MTLTDMFTAIGAKHGSGVEAIVRRLVDSGTPPGQWTPALAARIVAGNTAASAGGEAQALIDRETIGDYVPSSDRLRLDEVGHHIDQSRLRNAVETIAADLDMADIESVAQLITRIERLARAEAIEAAQTGYGKAMARSKKVQGWKRGLEADACQLCTWWWREGRIWPKDHTMPTHPGCACSQEFVTTTVDNIKPVTIEAYHASEKRRIDQEIAGARNDTEARP